MKKFLMVAAAICAFAVTSSNVQADVVTVSFDVTGVNSWDGLGNALNEVYGVDMGAGFDNYHVIGIGWDVDITTIGASWLSEASINFVDGGVNLAVSADDFTGSANYSSGGIVDLVGLALDWNQASNITLLEFFETFDDVAGAIDANWTGGFIEIQVERTNNVPEPATATIAGLCLLACGFTRRRRV